VRCCFDAPRGLGDDPVGPISKQDGLERSSFFLIGGAQQPEEKL
jgi:hypothetical protein